MSNRIRVQNAAASADSRLCFENATRQEDFCSVTAFCAAQEGDVTDPDEAAALLRTAFHPEGYFRFLFPEMLPVQVNWTSETGCKHNLKVPY